MSKKKVGTEQDSQDPGLLKRKYSYMNQVGHQIESAA